MIESILIEKAHIGRRLLSYALDLISTFLSTIILYFIVLHGVFSLGFNYIGNQKTIDKFNEEYVLNLKYGEKYTAYKEVVDRFYFVEFKDEILKEFKAEERKLTIEHIYNVVVLMLPESPTTEYHSSALYKYKVNADGSFNVDEVATLIEGSGAYYERNLEDLFYQTYKKLPVLLRSYEPLYNDPFVKNALYEDISRVLAFAIAISIFYLVIPIVNKNSTTLFEKILQIGYVNSSDNLSIKWYKKYLRILIYFTLPMLGIYWFTSYSVVCLCLLPFFINFVVILLNKNNRDLYEIFTRSIACDVEASCIFNTETDKNEFMSKENIKDKTFIENLKNIDEIDTIQTKGEKYEG